MNKSISDIIEEFIKSSLDDDDFIELSRNDLAKFFSCVPSQINYVLNTRFTLNRGFVVESQRGGNGYIKLVRITDNNNNFLTKSLEQTNKPINQVEASQLIAQMTDRKIITSNEADLLKCTISAKALNNPINIDNNLRSGILKQVIIELLKREGKIGKKWCSFIKFNLPYKLNLIKVN